MISAAQKEPVMSIIVLNRKSYPKGRKNIPNIRDISFFFSILFLLFRVTIHSFKD